MVLLMFPQAYMQYLVFLRELPITADIGPLFSILQYIMFEDDGEKLGGQSSGFNMLERPSEPPSRSVRYRRHKTRA